MKAYTTVSGSIPVRVGIFNKIELSLVLGGMVEQNLNHYFLFQIYHSAYDVKAYAVISGSILSSVGIFSKNNFSRELGEMVAESLSIVSFPNIA